MRGDGDREGFLAPKHTRFKKKLIEGQSMEDGRTSATAARVAAIVQWTEGVRRLSDQAAQQQQNYATVADALHRLRAACGGGTRVPAGAGEKEASFPPAARAPPSATLLHTAYQAPSLTGGTGGGGARNLRVRDACRGRVGGASPTPPRAHSW